MALSTAGLNVQQNALAAVIVYMSLHSATPNSSGSNETSAARVAVVMSNTNGVITMSGGAKNFTGGASNGAVHDVGYWSALTGGTFYGSAPTTGDASFNSAGEYTVDSASLTAS